MARWLLVALLASTGCTDLATPAELARPQILAVRADPPGIAEGGTSELTLLVAGPDGIIDDAEVSWAVAEPSPELPAIGAIEIDGDGTVRYVPPPEIGTLTFTSIEATAIVPDSPPLVALKAVGFGLNQPTANPNITELTVGGASLEDGDTVTLAVGETVALDVVPDVLITDETIVSWYCNAGEIELFRRTPAELIAQDEPGEGVLIVTFRDEQGGVAWRSVDVVVE